jgi:hypothetical protein
MIKTLGVQRTAMLAGLIAFVLVTAYANFYVFQPQAKSAASRLSSVRSEENELRSAIDVMRGEQSTFDQQRSLFEKLQKRQFIGEQDRVLAREIFNQMQRQSKLLSIKYQIRSAGIWEIADVTDDQQALMVSPIEITIEALDDVDVYRFVYYLSNLFPGKISIKSLKLERPTRLTPERLRSISLGNVDTLIRASIKAEWITMAPRQIIPTGAPGEDGGAQ